MRTAMLVVMLWSSAVAAGFATTPQGPKPDVGPGRVAWFDITTTDLPRSRDFYGQLFGWTFHAMRETDLAVEIVAGGTEIGTLRRAEGHIGGFNGVVYVQVVDVGEACRRATALGGTIVPGFPFDLPDGRGAIGLALDPAGHPIGMYSPTPLRKTPASK